MLKAKAIVIVSTSSCKVKNAIVLLQLDRYTLITPLLGKLIVKTGAKIVLNLGKSPL